LRLESVRRQLHASLRRVDSKLPEALVRNFTPFAE
jgi:hypothetical protein